MNELDTTKKIIISIILTAVVAGGGVYLVTKQKQGKSENISPALNDIAVGKPCDARNLKSYYGAGEIQDTKGLQCYMYDDLSDRTIHGGEWTYPSNQETSRIISWFGSDSSFSTFHWPGKTKLYEESLYVCQFCVRP